MDIDQNESALVQPLLYSSSDHNVSEVIEKINPKNAKRGAVVLSLIFILYHSYIHLRYGKDSCRWLLSDGRYKNDMGWQPYGCMMHIYSENDRILCMKSIAYRRQDNSFVFLGDHRIRNLYLTFRKHFPSDKAERQSEKPILDPFVQQSDLTYRDKKLRLSIDYLWAPYISSYINDLLNKWKTAKSVPRIIVIGSSTWSMKASNGSKEGLQDYYVNLTQLLHPFEEICKKSSVLWLLQEPVNEEKLNASNSMITNKLIDEYNNAAIKALKHSCVELWASSRLIAQGRLHDMPEGIELSPESLDTDVQLLLNMYCNDHMNHNDGTCCASSEPYTYLQLSAFVVLFVCLICGGFLLINPLYAYTSRYSDFRNVATSLAKLSFIMGYFYLCDRTNFFMKENKYYSSLSFFLPLAYVFTLGLFFTEGSRYTKIMNRDQTDEWKGWMQLVILIYQMTGAREQLPIYNHILILVAAYLFLSGYGHFVYLWFRGDAGFIRLLQVLFRLNFLTVVMCFCMNRPYQFYYFVPVVTFWFLLLYLVFVFPPRVTSASSETKTTQYIYVVLKILFLFVSISILYMSQVFFEKIFVTRPWKALFVTTDDDIENWWFRWKIDRFSALHGATFAFLLLLAQKFNFTDDNNHNNLFTLRVSFFVAVLALLGLLATSIYAIICPNRLEFVDIQTYISIVPTRPCHVVFVKNERGNAILTLVSFWQPVGSIFVFSCAVFRLGGADAVFALGDAVFTPSNKYISLALSAIVCYILLRNVSGILRTRFSVMFAFFGRISLELFVSHFHIWLSADANGVLVLVPRYPVINALVVSYIYVCISHELHCLTKKLLPYAVPADWRLASRNLFVFFLILIPAGIRDGMF